MTRRLTVVCRDVEWRSVMVTYFTWPMPVMKNGGRPSVWCLLTTMLASYPANRGTFITWQFLSHGNRGRPKVEIPLSAVTESRPKVTYHSRPKPYVPPKVKRDFRPKTETESQSYLSRHDCGSQQVPPSVRCPTNPPCIWHHSHLAPSCQPCGVSLMTRPQGPTVPDADADNEAASSV